MKEVSHHREGHASVLLDAVGIIEEQIRIAKSSVADSS